MEYPGAMETDRPHVSGDTVDAQTRCRHYHTALDIVAIQFYCCGRFYPCLHCHAESESHPIVPWPADRLDHPAILCGVCSARLAITAYTAAAACPECGAAFNPRCAQHSGVYFADPVPAPS